jgi:hypothetical protein
MTPAEVLTAVRDLYASAPTHVPSGTPVPSGTHCPLTALWEVTDQLRDEDLYWAARNALGRAAGPNPIDFNARHSTDEVVAALNQAIREVT